VTVAIIVFAHCPSLYFDADDYLKQNSALLAVQRDLSIDILVAQKAHREIH